MATGNILVPHFFLSILSALLILFRLMENITGASDVLAVSN